VDVYGNYSCRSILLDWDVAALSTSHLPSFNIRSFFVLLLGISNARASRVKVALAPAEYPPVEPITAGYMYSTPAPTSLLHDSIRFSQSTHPLSSCLSCQDNNPEAIMAFSTFLKVCTHSTAATLIIWLTASALFRVYLFRSLYLPFYMP
jgi:hypothetical protein